MVFPRFFLEFALWFFLEFALWFFLELALWFFLEFALHYGFSLKYCGSAVVWSFGVSQDLCRFVYTAE